MYERHQFKKKKQLPIVEEAKPLHDTKYVKKPVTVWIYHQKGWWFSKKPITFGWTKHGRFKNERGAIDSIKANVDNDHWHRWKPFYWIGDTPPSE